MITHLYNNADIITSLLEKSKKLLYELETANKYDDMSDTKIRMMHQVSVKNIYENCHSALDYTANLINEALELGIEKDKIYFPIYYKSLKFQEDCIVASIKAKCLMLYNFLYSVQPFIQGGENKWLKKFHSDNNKYKHQGFIPLRPFFKTRTLGWGQFGDIGVSVGEFSFSFGNPPIYTEKIDFTNDRSIEFQFRLEDGMTPVCEFLSDVIQGTTRIVRQVIQILYES